MSSDEYAELVEASFYANQLFSGFERMFKNIAKTFENNVATDGWHKALLQRMALEIQDIRPAVISEESLQSLNELRAFRHFFRHAYDMDIDKEKFKIVAHKVKLLSCSFKKDLNNFLTFLDDLLI